MTTLPNMSLVLPTRGAGGAGIWDDAIDAALGLVDEHNHTSGKGLRVPTTGININADLTFSSLYAPTNLHRISFASVAALAANNKSLFVDSSDNELYWRSNAGTNVKLTSGSSLNVAAFTGGFGGDYVSASAAAAFDDANKNYTFKSSGSAWARATFGGIRLIEFGTTETVRVGLLCPAGLGASYDVTWPLAVPGATRPVQMSSAGVLTAGDSDNVTVGGTLTSTGLITATAGVTAAANQHVTVSGTGRFKHGTLTIPIAAAAFNPAAGVTISLNAGSITFGITTNPAARAPIMLLVGARVVAIRAFVQDNATGPSTLTASFSSISSTGSVTTIASSSASSGSGANQTLTIGGLTTTIAASTSYALNIAVTSGSGSTCTVYMAEVDYDFP